MHIPLPLSQPCEATHIRALDIDDILFQILKRVLLPSAEPLLTFNHFDGPRGKETPFFKPTCAPILVCRRWYNIGRQVAFSCASLSPEIWRFDRPWFPNLLAHVSQLHYIFPRPLYYEGDEFCRILSNLNAPRSADVFAPTSRLRELWLSGISHAAERVLSLRNLSQRNRITLLMASAEIEFDTAEVHWDTLLSALTASSPDSLRLPHLKHLLLYGGRINRLPSTWSLNTPIRLTTLSLCRVAEDNLRVVRALLLGVATPSLEQLSMAQSRFFFEDLFTKDFLARWAPLCSSLHRMQLDGIHEVPRIALTLAEYFPQAERMASMYRYYTYLSCTITISHKLTRLEIACNGGDAGYSLLGCSQDIQEFLCSQAATQLQEATLPGLLYDPKVLHPALYVITPEVGCCPPWSCSSLSTLLLCIDTHYRQPCKGYSDGPVAVSRVVCGFLAVSCPKLKSLDLRFMEDNFDLDPEGGLCFLGRLSKLEHLTIRGSGYQRRCKSIMTRNVYATWPYNTAVDRTFVQGSSRVGISRFLGKKTILVPVLRWLAVEPSELDRERRLTNLSRCDYVLNKLIVENDMQNMHRRQPMALSQWVMRLQAMLTVAKDQMREGSLWQQLETFHCHLQSFDLRSRGCEDSKDRMTFVAGYKAALKGVLPHVDVAIHPRFQAE